MDEVQFDEEGIKFRYLSNWKEQNKEMIGPNCIKALVKVVEGNDEKTQRIEIEEKPKQLHKLKRLLRKALKLKVGL